MKKTIQFQMPLSLEDSFNLLYKSGNDIPFWRAQQSDFEHGYIEWKQSIWALTGTAIIQARLEQIAETETLVVVIILKPFQFLDPFHICEKVFNKLENSLEKNYLASKE